MEKLKIALAGNPNCGKTTLFNDLTGSHQYVGNWPGVTVDRLDGHYEYDGTRVDVTDLPGIYSFSAYSIDETIARKHILEEHPDVVVNVLDATNLERNLYLTTQLLEMRVPVVVALNMMDLAKRRSIRIEAEHLARHLGCPVVPVVASKGLGVDELRDVIRDAGRERRVSSTRVEYDSELEKAVERIMEKVESSARKEGVDARWFALKILEGDELALELSGALDLDGIVARESRRVEKHTGDDLDIVIADGRYGFIHGLSRDVVHRDGDVRRTVSDRIDKVLLNRVLGIPAFLMIMYVVFMLTINAGGPFVDFFDKLCGTIFVDGFSVVLSALCAPEWVVNLLANGVGGGIQTVSTFIPPIFMIFLCLAFLEDSGYMARAAFVMDRFLRTVGLPGKAFIPMLVGFGCNVPAIMATRTLENNRDRILTILMNPFMSCGARLPVYTLFAAAFFPYHGGSVIFSLYVMGIVLAILTGLLFKKTILQGEVSTFVMELPPYHLPTFRGIMYHTWNRLRDFIVRAGRVIMVVVIALSFLNAIGTDGSFGNEDSDKSIISAIGKKVVVVFRPLGLEKENWPAAVGLFTGVLAKEAVVGTLDSLYARIDASTAVDKADEEKFDFWHGVEEAFAAIPAGFKGLARRYSAEEDATDGLRNPAKVATGTGVSGGTVSVMTRFFDGKIGAFAYLLFILIYAPCVAATAAIARETNLKWAAFSVFYLTLLAWIISTVFYQTGTFFRHPASSALWLVVSALILGALYAGLKFASRRIRVKA